MIDLRQRNNAKELMDGDNISFEAMSQTLKELNIINSRLGGHAITLSGVRQLLVPGQPVTICEIGCGGGDNIFVIYKYCQRNNIPVVFTGVDLNPECIAFAQLQYPEIPCEWICSDYAKVEFGNRPPDIIFSSLFCHHFTNEQLVFMLKWMQQNSRKGFFINDLQRHWLAYYLIKYITKFFSKSYLVRNDASISVARSFVKKDWIDLFQQAGLSNYLLKWRWAFRFLILYKK